MKLISKETTEILQIFYQDNNYKDILDIIKTLDHFTDENIGDYSVYFKLIRICGDRLVWSYFSSAVVRYRFINDECTVKLENIYQQEIRKQKFKILLDGADK